MEYMTDFYHNKGNVVTYPMLLAGAIFAFFALMGISDKPAADTYITLVPNTTVVNIGDTFVTDVIVSSDTSVNVFAGTIAFDPSIAVVEDITYNTSTANLWTEEPWYKNDDGTITFAGGTTQIGGFVGSGQLMTIMFRSKQVGRQKLSLEDVHILEHDGLGTETDVSSSDVFVSIQNNPSSTTNIYSASSPVEVVVINKAFDLNGDGKIGLADVSAFFVAMMSNEKRADFNNDGRVNIADLSMLLSVIGTTLSE